jgi:RHS repeat-associated protein
VKYQLGDHLGSSNVIVNDAGDWVNREEYTPYGETSFGSFARKQYRFTGKEGDEESGLYYHGARYYAPWLLRWTNCDPAGIIDGLNLYQYVNGNPLKLVDPNGLDGEMLPGGTGKTPEELANGSQPQMEREVPKGGKDAEPPTVNVHDLPDAPSQSTSKPASQSPSKKENTGQILKPLELIPTPEGDYETSDHHASSAGGIPTNSIRRFPDTRREFLAEQYPALAPRIRGAEREEIFINDVAPVLLTVLTANPGGLAEGELGTLGIKSTGKVITEAESYAALNAEAAGGTRLWIVGETVENTYAIRINGNRITYDTLAPANQGKVRSHMKVIMNNLSEGEADWWTGTHGTPEGHFMGEHLEFKFFRQERGYGRYYGYNVKNVYGQSRASILAAAERPTVYSWCYSSSCFLP